MAKLIKWTAALSLGCAVLFSVCCRIVSCDVFLPFAITFGTIFYHLSMRLLVALVFTRVMNNKADYHKKRYQVSTGEMKLYGKLRVKKWKDKMPTYVKALFDPGVHTWDEIAQAMCQAELVHKMSAALSFLPVAGGIFFGAFPVFITTSVLAALFDMTFVIMQRYNRYRLMKLLEHGRGK